MEHVLLARASVSTELSFSRSVMPFIIVIISWKTGGRCDWSYGYARSYKLQIKVDVIGWILSALFQLSQSNSNVDIVVAGLGRHTLCQR